MPSAVAYSLPETLASFGITLDMPALLTGNLVNDSRSVVAGDVFCAVLGQLQDGRKYSSQAVEQGAVAVLSECVHTQQHGKVTALQSASGRSVPVIHFYQLGQQLFALAQQYYQQPQKQLQVIGVTGTNGKTSTSLLIAKLLTQFGEKSAVIGTIGAGLLDDLQPICNTTPGPTELNQWLARFVADDVVNVAMEVSSHALVQQRLQPELIDIAVFTNLSRDHLDFHQTMDAYADAKKMLFTGGATQVAILNGDDAVARQWLNDWPLAQPVIVYGRGKELETFARFLRASDIVQHTRGVNFLLNSELGSVAIESPLFGDFNIDNLLAALAVLLARGVKLQALPAAVAALTPIIGRMERFCADGKATAVVDYAHTPDALDNALQACRHHCSGQLWLVFGCGGDRDRGKRALMGRIAEQGAEHVVITNDNPRTEAPELIAQDILSGCEQAEKVTVMLDRRQAVLSTLAKAKADDMVLLAGKGHEDYIVIGDEKKHYDERALVAQFYQQEALS